VLVVNDEWPARNYLVELIESSGLAEIAGALPTAEDARAALEDESGLSVDGVFLDVDRADDDDARAALDLIRENAMALSFALTTACDRHTVMAFELGVIDYILKPFNEERVSRCLVRMLERRRMRDAHTPMNRRIVARRRRSIVFLEPEEVLAFEAAGRLTYVHTVYGRFDIDLSLAAIESSFGRELTRVHRNWLVRLAYVKELERDGPETKVFLGAQLEDRRGFAVPVARNRANELRTMLLANARGLRRA
jgi:DNA-binding LytR/AlgR family response regulator